MSDASPVVIDGGPNVIAVENEVAEDTNQGLITPGNSKALSGVVGVFVSQGVDGVSVDGCQRKDIFNAIMKEGSLQ